MARIRSIKPEFWESESVGRLTMGSRLLFIACLNFADDEGLLRWNEAYLQSQAFAYDELAPNQLTEWMQELVRERIVLPYKSGVGAQRLGWIINFRKHQVINRPQPSKLPPPSLKNIDVSNAYMDRDEWRCGICGKEILRHGDVNEVGSKMGSLDHIKAVSRGGGDHPSNIRAAHISCNKSRGVGVNDSVNDSLLEGNGKEGNGKEGNLLALTSKNGHDLLADQDPVVERIPLVGKQGEFEVRKSMRDELDRLYPAVDPDQTLREIRGWCIGNPTKCKTRRGVRAFVMRWFGGEQDKQSRRPG